MAETTASNTAQTATPAAADEPPLPTAAASASADIEVDPDGNVDIESQQQQQELEEGTPVPVEKPLSTNINSSSIVATKNVGIFAGDEDDTASVFSFDSYEKTPRIPLRIQNKIRRKMQSRQNNEAAVGGGDTTTTGNVDDSGIPFPSVIGASALEFENAVNVCPCRCLFFTLKETICLVMSLLGCAVFMAGLIILCMYLEGSLFNNIE